MKPSVAISCPILQRKKQSWGSLIGQTDTSGFTVCNSAFVVSRPSVAFPGAGACSKVAQAGQCRASGDSLLRDGCHRCSSWVFGCWPECCPSRGSVAGRVQQG